MSGWGRGLGLMRVGGCRLGGYGCGCGGGGCGSDVWEGGGGGGGGGGGELGKLLHVPPLTASL